MSVSKIDEKKFWINEYGLLLFRNKYNKDMVLKRPYHWCENNYLVIDEGKQNLIVQTPKLHEINFKDWIPIIKEEYEEEKHFRELQKNYKYLIHDTCDTDTYVRERVKGILTEKEIDGDSYGVPSIEDIVDSLCKIIETNKMKEEPNPNYKNAPVNILYGHGKDFVEVRDNTEEKLAEGFVKGVFEIIELKKENKKLQEMFDMQVKLVTALEVEKIELEKGVKNACQYAQENLKSSVELTDKVKQLELDNEELHNIIKALTKGKLPCNPDHNGECLVCDNWLSGCILLKNEKNT